MFRAHDNLKFILWLLLEVKSRSRNPFLLWRKKLDQVSLAIRFEHGSSATLCGESRFNIVGAWPKDLIFPCVELLQFRLILFTCLQV